MDIKTKLIALGVGVLVLVLLLAVFISSCSAGKQAAENIPTPTPPVVEATPTPEPVATREPVPVATPAPVPVTEPALPTTPTVSPTPVSVEPDLSAQPTVTEQPEVTPTTAPTVSGEKEPVEPTFDFGLPAVANTDTRIAVRTAKKNMKSVVWNVTKESEFGTAVNASGMISELDMDGGTISFKEPGKYTVSATAKGENGKKKTVTCAIEVFTPEQFAFGLPHTAYTFTVVDIDVLSDGDGDIAWSVTKDGESMALSDAFNGILDKNGGMVTFHKEGRYVLTGRTVAGKEYSAIVQVFAKPDSTSNSDSSDLY